MKSHAAALEGIAFLVAIGVVAILFGSLSYHACVHLDGFSNYAPNAPLAGYVTGGMFLMVFYAVLVDARLKTQLWVLGMASVVAISFLIFGF